MAKQTTVFAQRVLQTCFRLVFQYVQERTGHRSLKALHMYERTTTSQHTAVSNVLTAAGNVSLPSTTGLKSSSEHVPNALPTIFGSVSNCVINVNMTAPSSTTE